MISKPWFSRPSKFATGTSTSSNSIYVEPVVLERLATASARITTGRVRTTCLHARVLELPTRHARHLEWDDERRHALPSLASRSHRSRAVVGKDAVGDPFLGTVDNIPVALALGRRGDPSNVGSRCGKSSSASPVLYARSQWLTVWLRHAEAEPRAAIQYRRQELSLLLLVAVVDQRRRPNRVATRQGPYDAEVAAPCDFVDDNQVMEAVPFARLDIAGQPLSHQVVLRQRVYGGRHVSLSSVLCDDLLQRKTMIWLADSGLAQLYRDLASGHTGNCLPTSGGTKP